jgi:preprotein translocase subunit SecY
MFDKLKAVWQYKDVRNRVLFTVVMLALYRLVIHIPLPGVDVSQLKQFFAQNQLLGLVDIFSGGSMSNFSIALLGVVPFINASIIMQLMTMAIPSLEALQKEGEYGRKKIALYTRYLTVPLALIMGYGTLISLKQSSFQILATLSPAHIAAILITATAGTILLMWFGELITEKGIGNGVSLIVFAGIIARIPSQFSSAFALSSVNGVGNLIIFALLAIVITFLIVYINEGQRNIPIAYAGRAANNRLFGGVSTHLPLKVNQAGVVPIIFAVSLILFPGLLAQLFIGARSAWLSHAATLVKDFFANQTYYGIIYFLLVVIFSFFYTWIIFNPEKVAENIQKQGGFIPGIRPGVQTEKYLSYLINRITFFGGIFLALLAVLPIIVQNIFNLGSLTLGGISTLIVVSVALDTMRQIDAQLVMKRYENL